MLDGLFSVRREGSSVVADPDESWSNSWGGLFGGYLVGLALHRMCDQLPEGQDVTSAHAQFLRPAEPIPTLADPTGLVVGRNVTTGRVDLVQRGSQIVSVAATATRLRQAESQPCRPGADIVGTDDEEHYDISRVLGRHVPFLHQHLKANLIASSSREASATRLLRVSLRPGIVGAMEPLPVAALALMSDLVGVHLFESVAMQTGSQRAIMALDLTLNVLHQPLGDAVDLVSTGVMIQDDHVVGSARLYGETGFAGLVTQHALVREYRP